MTENIFFAALFFPAVAAVLIFLMKYTSAILQARVRLAQDEAYREIATQAATAQTNTAAALTALTTKCVDIQLRLAGLEKILKEVE